MKYYISAAIKTLSFFAILPIAAQLLPKDEVGRFFFWLAVIQIGAALSTLGFSSAVARYSYNRAKVDYMASIGLLVSLLSWVLVVVIAGGFGLLSLIVATTWLVRCAALIGESRAVSAGHISRLSNLYVAYAIVMPTMSLLSIITFGATHEALLVGFVVAEATMAVGTLSSIRFRLRFDSGYIASRVIPAGKKGALYGLPLVFAGLANMGLSNADRFIVAGFWDFQEVADFSIMYTIAFASGRFITAPTNLKVFPEFVRGQNDDVVFRRVRKTAGTAFVISSCYCAVVAALGPHIVEFIGGDEYKLVAADFALVSAASAMFLLFTLNAAHLKFTNRTLTFAAYLFAGFAISIMLSLYLVPTLGYRGASISTLVAYSVLGLISLLRMRPILFDVWAVVLGAALIALTLTWTLVV